MTLRILVVSASDRPNSASLEISRYIESHCKEIVGLESVSVLDLNKENLPLWDQGFWDEEARWLKIWEPISQRLVDSDGFIIITPEWNGMAPPALKNFLLLCEPKEIGHKPNLIVSISAGHGGTYPISELRAFGFKNNKMCHIPDHVLIQKVNSVLGEIKRNNAESYILKRLKWSIYVLVQYALVMKNLRSDSILFDEKYEDGM